MFSIGFSVLSNLGFVAVGAVLLFDWFKEEKFDIGKVFSLFAIVCILFFQVHRNTVISILNTKLAKATVQRFSGVLNLEDSEKDTHVR